MDSISPYIGEGLRPLHQFLDLRDESSIDMSHHRSHSIVTDSI